MKTPKGHPTLPINRSRHLSLLLAAGLLVGPMAIPSYAQQGSQGQSGQLVTIGMVDQQINTALSILSDQLPGTVTAFGNVSGNRVTVLAEDQPVESVLNQIANPNGWVWWREDNGDYGIADRDYYERNVLPKRVIQKVFRPNNVQASELDRAIKGLLTPNNVGSSVADDRTNKLIVDDLPQAIERIERFIREIDVQLIVRVFYIRHANVEDIAAKIESYKSGPGTIEVDRTTHQIIVTDLLSNIKKMELLIDILDVGPEIVIYDINNIGIDGKDLEDIQQIIDSIRTPELLFEVDHKQGVVILEDVPEVHERVEQILAEFDRPVRQVLIQSEILSTSFKREFSFGLTEAAYGMNPLENRAGDGQMLGYNFLNPDQVFPNFVMSGNTLRGAYVSSRALVQYQATFEDSSTRTLLQPRLLVKNQEPSEVFVGNEVPYLTTFFDDRVGGVGRTTSTQNTVSDGLTFNVTPSISNSLLIELELDISNDQAQPTTASDGERTRTLIGRSRQNVRTTLQLPSGQTRMIGGLIDNTSTRGSSGLPFLSSLPIIGALFGMQSSENESRNLMIFITATVVDEDAAENTGPDGRRGRSVTRYDRIPGEYFVEEEAIYVDPDDTGEIEQPTMFESMDSMDMLSGELEDEAAMLERFRESQRERRASQEEDSGNYVASRPLGSARLNTGEAPERRPPSSQGTVRMETAPPGRTQERRPGTQQQPQQGQQQQPGTGSSRTETNYQ
ncbi:MAG: type II secretion system protein GspD [Candidatus Sumerlaeia bacterium]|nr:type II secretion system protein GspD [Candidatus Sumerlaeia bacterium]